MKIPLGKMKWLGAQFGSRGFKCFENLFPDCICQPHKIEICFLFRFFFSLCLLWVVYIQCASYHVICRCRCYGTWLIVFAFDFHSIKFLFSTPIHYKHDEHVPTLCHLCICIHTHPHTHTYMWIQVVGPYKFE